ncbi:hypothetical protein EZI54_07165 [Marinobacter halodurans]|uniref:Uncharacterized protein n=1 Tax=Marinobacter halodurans TaxID=2528979 RepID=A0ABY1ZR26_9GAMM|nr:hypothetical protein [Marinobacter halodurans]TBW57431.1 hypothetical protein EZI54_07165 [Marinobacter halodurans]
MLIPPLYLSQFRQQGPQGELTEVRIDTGELSEPGEKLVDSILFKNEKLPLPAELIAVSDQGQEFMLTIETHEIGMSIDEFGSYMAGGGQVTVVEHCQDGHQTQHKLAASGVFDSRMDWLEANAKRTAIA